MKNPNELNRPEMMIEQTEELADVLIDKYFSTLSYWESAGLLDSLKRKLKEEILDKRSPLAKQSEDIFSEIGKLDNYLKYF